MGAVEVALAETREATLAALGKLAAAERQARLAEAAKKEHWVAISLRLAWKNA